jgi:hypothetical protein
MTQNYKFLNCSHCNKNIRHLFNITLVHNDDMPTEFINMYQTILDELINRCSQCTYDLFITNT